MYVEGGEYMGGPDVGCGRKRTIRAAQEHTALGTTAEVKWIRVERRT